MIEVHWSDHAIERVAERFGPREDLLIPTQRIQQFAAHCLPGKTYRVKNNGIIFVCAKINSTRVLIVTVMQHER